MSRRRHYDPGPAIRRRRRLGRWLLGIVGAVLLAGIAGERLRMLSDKGPDAQRFDKQTFIVDQVVDGDTVHIRAPDGGERTKVRLLGIDAPELHPPGRPADYWAHESTDALRRMAENRAVIVRLEPLEHRDRYGRLLAYLYLEPSEMINLALVREGHVYADRRFPHSHGREFERAEAEAQRKQRGLWKDVRPDQMPDWRRRWMERRED